MNDEPVRIWDAAYGSHERQRFDLILPAHYENRRGLILFFHGGAWIGGDKAGYREELELWCEKGWASASMNYHYLAPDARMDTLTGDITLALYAIRAKAAAFGCGLTRALLTGISAGGHLSLLYAYAFADSAPIRPVCVVVWTEGSIPFCSYSGSPPSAWMPGTAGMVANPASSSSSDGMWSTMVPLL